MTEIKDSDREIHRFRMRLTALMLFVLICFGLLVARFVWLQVIKHDQYMAQAEDNRIALVPIVPNRGLIVDRNGVVLAATTRPTRSRSRRRNSRPTWIR
jgi:penicillin-binding protein 2